MTNIQHPEGPAIGVHPNAIRRGILCSSGFTGKHRDFESVSLLTDFLGMPLLEGLIHPGHRPIQFGGIPPLPFQPGDLLFLQKKGRRVFPPFLGHGNQVGLDHILPTCRANIDILSAAFCGAEQEDGAQDQGDIQLPHASNFGQFPRNPAL